MGKVINALMIMTYASVVVINGLAAATKFIGSVTIAEISSEYSTLITPAGYVFSI